MEVDKSATGSYSLGSMSELKNVKLHRDGGRVCEEFTVKRIVRRDFVVVDESEPIWMWSLKSIYVRNLFILKKTTINFLDTF